MSTKKTIKSTFQKKYLCLGPNEKASIAQSSTPNSKLYSKTVHSKLKGISSNPENAQKKSKSPNVYNFLKFVNK